MTNETVSMFLQLLLQALVVPALVSLTVYGVKWLAAKVTEAKAKVPKDVLDTIDHVAETVVWAAEQSGLKHELMQTGKAKKAWAMNYGEQVLKQQLGLTLDLDKLGDKYWKGVVDALDAAIEAKVAQSFNYDKFFPAETEASPAST
jgi:hypothetical protein